MCAVLFRCGPHEDSPASLPKRDRDSPARLSPGGPFHLRMRSVQERIDLPSRLESSAKSASDSPDAAIHGRGFQMEQRARLRAALFPPLPLAGEGRVRASRFTTPINAAASRALPEDATAPAP